MTKVLLAIYDCLARRPWNDVWYKYVGGGNGAGQVSSRQDASGVTEYGYDETGNVTESRKTCVIPGNRGTLTMVTRWSYDSHGRVLTVTYPDGEEVSYTYDRGGSLCGMAGEKPGQPRTVYIDTLQYNTYGQRTYIRYGNGVTTTYSYNPIDHRLIHLRDSSSLTGELLQDNSYSYDREGNILGIADQGRLGRVQSYRYDDLYRLVHSQGEMGALGLSYDSEYGYSAAGRLTKKRVSSLRLGSRGLYPVNYDNEYRYPYGSNPFAAERITDGHGNHDLKWDDDGNMTGCGDGREERRMCWTEEGRLQAYWDRQRDEGVLAAYYSYDGAGERSLKLTSPRVETVQNAEQGTVSMRYATLYATPLVTINRGGYTKHYFEGSNRVCTAVGGGFGGVDWSEVAEQVPAVSGSYGRMHEMQDEGVNKAFEGCFGVGASVKGVYNLPAILEKQERWRNVAEPLHFYHGDHLGSAAYLTDRDGHVVQTLAYLPYGEDWVEQNGLSDTSRLGMYRYNGKERDGESGYHYYGARYYWSELWNGWLSVDPMADKYPSLSPYNYCAWNPVVFVDPNGMIIDSASVSENIKTLLTTSSAFADAYETLSNDQDNIYSFNVWGTSAIEDGRKIDGNLLYDGEKVIINHIEMDDNYALFEEVAHALQYYNGDIGFIKTYNKERNLQWGTIGLDCMDEINAKEWAAKVANRVKTSYSVTDLTNDGYNVKSLGLEPRTAYQDYKGYLNSNPGMTESSYNTRGWIEHSFIRLRKKE